MTASTVISVTSASTSNRVISRGWLVAQPANNRNKPIMIKRFMSAPFMFTKTVHPGAMFVKK